MIARVAFQAILFVVALGSALFLAAGTWRWPAAWVLIGEMGAGEIALGFWLRRHDESLFAERLSGQFQSSQPSQDKALVSALMLSSVASFVLMGLDAVRFGWSHVPPPLQVVGAILVALGGVLAYLTFRENTYAATVVKIQRERGHRVISTGPYAYVRHPMYSGLISFYVGAPLLLGSWYGLVAAIVSVGIIAARAAFEERTLASELEGYHDYAQSVQYRLLPGLW